MDLLGKGRNVRGLPVATTIRHMMSVSDCHTHSIRDEQWQNGNITLSAPVPVPVVMRASLYQHTKSRLFVPVPNSASHALSRGLNHQTTSSVVVTISVAGSRKPSRMQASSVWSHGRVRNPSCQLHPQSGRHSHLLVISGRRMTRPGHRADIAALIKSVKELLPECSYSVDGGCSRLCNSGTMSSYSARYVNTATGLRAYLAAKWRELKLRRGGNPLHVHNAREIVRHATRTQPSFGPPQRQRGAWRTFKLDDST